MSTPTMNGGRAFDGRLFDAVNEFARDTPWLHGIAATYANLGVLLFAGLLLAGWWAARRRDSRAVAAALWAGAATLAAVALNQPLVNAVHEARPYTTEPRILVLTHRSADFSFPSDHAVMAGAAAAGLWLVSRRLGAVATIAAVLMAAARVYTAAHYPHDVAAGLLLGAAVAPVGWLCIRRPLTHLVDRITRTPLRPILHNQPLHR